MDENAYIDRHITQCFEDYEKIFKALLITGPRQSGKSTLLKHEKPDLKYVTFDNMVVRKQFIDDPINFFKIYKMPIILDEVQREKNLFLQIKYEIDNKKDLAQVYMSGSESFLLMNNISESLAGRVGVLNLLPLSLREKYNIKYYNSFLPTSEYIENRRNYKITFDEEDIWDHIFLGGMPALFNGEYNDKEKYFSSYVTTYIERDVRSLSQVGNVMKFYDFMVALAATVGNLLNIESISNDLKINRKTCEHYISILEASHVIYLLKPYHNNQLARLINTPKLYFLDTGLLTYLLGWKDKNTTSLSPMAGAFFENFVISEIIKSYYNKGIMHLPLSFYRDKDKKEIDLLIKLNGVLYPIEIKKHASIDKNDVKNFSVLENIKNVNIKEGALISTYNEPILIKDNMWNIPVWYI